MMRWDPKSLLKFADIVPGHHLRSVRELPGFDSWGVDYKPGSWPDVLWIGDGSADFNPKCHPFMAAHEALHSISTRYTDLDDYQFFLYNICEDWRVNTCLLGIYGDREIQVAEQAAPAQVSHLHSAPAPLLHEPPAFSEGGCPGERQRLLPGDALSAPAV